MVKNITLAPRNRAQLLDDSAKVGTINLTKQEKLTLAKGVDTPLWDVIMKIWRKQRALQIAATSLNMAQNEGDLWFYKGVLAENGYIEKELRKIAEDFKKAEKTKESPAQDPKPGEQPSPAGAREKISSVK